MSRFETYCRHREELALRASLSGFRNIEDKSAGDDLVVIRNDFTRRLFDGDFYRSVGVAGRIAVSLVFVQSRDGNTVAPGARGVAPGVCGHRFVDGRGAASIRARVRSVSDDVTD